MLVSQAARASEIFLSKVYFEDKIDDVYNKILKEKQSVVLIGMPSSGKSTVGRIIAEKTGKDFIDTDTLIEEKTKKRIFEIFTLFGEEKFRDIESEAVKKASEQSVVNRIYSPKWERPVEKISLRPVYHTIPDGTRNISLTSIAGQWHSMGYSREAIYRELLYVNSVACNPPLDIYEIQCIVNSVTRYRR